MAGGYSHLTLVRHLTTRASNKGQGGSPTAVQKELGELVTYLGHYVFLGGVCPDYPYLAGDDEWADWMHKGKTDIMVKHAMKAIHEQRLEDMDGPLWRQQFTWLLGFISHVIADVVVHPIVNIKVGKYEENKKAHRTCEMNQDVWIYKAVTNMDLSVADNMKNEIKKCGDDGRLNDGIQELWGACLEEAYGRQPQEGQLDIWHKKFIRLLAIAEEAGEIPLFGRILVNEALAYPPEIDMDFIDQLETPTDDAVNDNEQPVNRGNPRSFKTIFDKTTTHAEEAWSVLAQDMFADALGVKHQAMLKDWSLDTGIDNGAGKLYLWPEGKTLDGG